MNIFPCAPVDILLQQLQSMCAFTYANEYGLHVTDFDSHVSKSCSKTLGMVNSVLSSILNSEKAKFYANRVSIYWPFCVGNTLEDFIKVSITCKSRIPQTTPKLPSTSTT